MFINADRPMRSLRTINTPDGKLLQVGGSAYVNVPSSGATPWDDLTAWGRQNFDTTGTGAAPFAWTTQDYSSADGLPIIGRIEPDSSIYVATGFGGWGLTTAAVAAELIRDQIHGTTSDWHTIFDPSRALPLATTDIISGHRSGLGIDPQQALETLPVDTAIVLELDGEEVAAYRDPSGTLHRVSAACTHLGCIVLWDAAGRQWECPCHASRFAPDGTVLKGPAKEPLPAR
jgi:Rieske Fe-S protein